MDLARLCEQAELLQRQGRNAEALASFNKALTIDPDCVGALFGRGLVLAELKHFAEASASFDRVIALSPAAAEAFQNRGSALMNLGRFAEARADFNAALALKPDLVPALYNRGNLEQHEANFAAALASYDKALAAQADFAEGWNGRGTALHRLGRLSEALKSYDRALALQPAFGEAHYNRALTSTELGHYEEALADYDRAIAAGAHVAEARRNQGLCHLLLRRFEPGWRLYESRAQRDDPRLAGRPRWRGEDIAGKTLFLTWEQGLGDTIQFSRYAPLCVARGAKVILSVQKPLLGLLRQLGPAVTVIGPDEPPGAFDFHCPLLSLPLAFGTSPATIPAQIPSLAGEDGLAKSWMVCLPPKTKPRIGLAWRGSPGHTGDHHRSMDFNQLLFLFDPAFDWLCLQKDVKSADLVLLNACGRVAYFGEAQREFSDTAAMMETVDLVISVDTAVAHLAGAMGKPVWIMLPYNPDWRWQLDRQDCPWYPTARLFRQPCIGDWTAVVERIKDALAPLREQN